MVHIRHRIGALGSVQAAESCSTIQNKTKQYGPTQNQVVSDFRRPIAMGGAQ
jgi:hypothetical protein